MIWIESDNPNGFQTGRRFPINEPSPCIMAGGMGGDSLGHWHIHDDGKAIPMPRVTDGKPPYAVPSMDDIRALPWNGYTVASTFAGGGGSSTGYRMAGFKVLWANELTASARASYAANMDPGTILDGRDIRKVQAADILAATGLKPGELDIFDGSPPCVSFSTAGKREKGWGKVTTSHDATQRQDDLFFEYVRLLKGLQPRVFVAENVSGLIKGTAKGYFLEILAALKGCGYRVEARLLDAQWLGVPQMRQRLIFVGVREGLGAKPAFPAPLGYRYSVRDALPWIDGLESGHGFHGHAMEPAGKPAPVILAGRAVRAKVMGVGTYKGMRSSNEPAPSILTHGRSKTRSEMSLVRQPSRLIGNSNAPYTRKNASYSADNPCPTLISRRQTVTIEAGNRDPLRLPPSRARAYDGAEAFGITIADKARPSPTITIASPGNDLGHPTERRKFTIAELRRICSFPDDYELKGTYADQWARCGNAVPPVMMRAIAETIRDRVLIPLDRKAAA